MSHKKLPSYNMAIFAIGTLVVIGGFATEIYLPSMVSMQKALHTSLHMVQLTITAYLFGYAISSLIGGVCSDCYGRFKIVFICLIIGLVGSIINVFTLNIEMLLLGRFIQGLGLGGVTVITRAIVRDISRDKRHLARLSSLIGIIYATILAVAPLIGGYIEKYTFWRINFLFMLLLTVFTMVLHIRYLPETNKHIYRMTLSKALHSYATVMSNKKFMLYNMVSALTLMGILSYQAVSAFLLQVRVGLSPQTFGFTALIITLSIVLGGIINRLLIGKYKSEYLLKISSILMLLTGIVYVIFGILNYVIFLSILIPIMLYFFSAGVVYPNASAGAMDLHGDSAGLAAAVYNFIQLISATLGTFLVSVFHTNGPLNIGIMFVFIGIVSFIFSSKLHNYTDTNHGNY